MDLGHWDWSGDEDRPDWERVWTGLRDGAFLDDEDGVFRRGLVSVNVGWLARGGLLHLEIPGLRFEPNPLERLLRARTRYFAFADIDRVERRPARPGEVLPGGVAPRIRLHLRDARPVDIIPAGDTLDEWLGAIVNQHEVWQRRARFA
jgi:hypothetical protein